VKQEIDAAPINYLAPIFSVCAFSYLAPTMITFGSIVLNYNKTAIQMLKSLKNRRCHAFKILA
jgi:hypothetical protein